MYFQYDTNSSVLPTHYSTETRMNSRTKKQKIIEMLDHFSSMGVEEITIADISKFMQTKVYQAQWFNCWVRVPFCGRLRLPQIFY